MVPRKFLKILGKNTAFSCKIFTCFEIHPVNRGRPSPHPSPLNPPRRGVSYPGPRDVWWAPPSHKNIK